MSSDWKDEMNRVLIPVALSEVGGPTSLLLRVSVSGGCKGCCLGNFVEDHEELIADRYGEFVECFELPEDTAGCPPFACYFPGNGSFSSILLKLERRN